MKHFREYKIDFTNFFNGSKRTITLGKTKEESNEMLKKSSKHFYFWWRKSQIYC